MKLNSWINKLLEKDSLKNWAYNLLIDSAQNTLSPEFLQTLESTIPDAVDWELKQADVIEFYNAIMESLRLSSFCLGKHCDSQGDIQYSRIMRFWELQYYGIGVFRADSYSSEVYEKALKLLIDEPVKFHEMLTGTLRGRNQHFFWVTDANAIIEKASRNP